jgi:hypothetical protein
VNLIYAVSQDNAIYHNYPKDLIPVELYGAGRGKHITRKPVCAYEIGEYKRYPLVVLPYDVFDRYFK